MQPSHYYGFDAVKKAGVLNLKYPIGKAWRPKISQKRAKTCSVWSSTNIITKKGLKTCFFVSFQLIDLNISRMGFRPKLNKL